MDNNDSMGPGEAGSTLKYDTDYPLKALYNVDNTFRLPYGSTEISASVPGMCISYTDEVAGSSPVPPTANLISPLFH